MSAPWEALDALIAEMREYAKYTWPELKGDVCEDWADRLAALAQEPTPRELSVMLDPPLSVSCYGPNDDEPEVAHNSAALLSFILRGLRYGDVTISDPAGGSPEPDPPPDDEFTEDEIRIQREDFVKWLDMRDIPAEVRAMLTPWLAHEGETRGPLIEAPPAPQGWQPIDTAPKDGSQILCAWVLTLSNGTHHNSGVYHVLQWWADWHGDGQGAWVLDGDFHAHFIPDEVHETPPVKFGDPTHWMPLPPPPTGAPR